jgi:hypothetical protein
VVDAETEEKMGWFIAGILQVIVAIILVGHITGKWPDVVCQLTNVC